MTTKLHRLHGVVERYVLLSGEGVVEVGELVAQHLSAGDVVIIPPECQQRITNIGQDDLVFLAICSPHFTPEVYESLAEDVKL